MEDGVSQGGSGECGRDGKERNESLHGALNTIQDVEFLGVTRAAVAVPLYPKSE